MTAYALTAALCGGLVLLGRGGRKAPARPRPRRLPQARRGPWHTAAAHGVRDGARRAWAAARRWCAFVGTGGTGDPEKSVPLRVLVPCLAMVAYLVRLEQLAHKAPRAGDPFGELLALPFSAAALRRFGERHPVHACHFGLCAVALCAVCVHAVLPATCALRRLLGLDARTTRGAGAKPAACADAHPVKRHGREAAVHFRRISRANCLAVAGGGGGIANAWVRNK